MKESYCSFEVSKLLKEKGFDWDCITYYVDSEPNDVKYSMLFENNTTWEERCYSAPTHQMAMAYLREKYGFHIYTFYEDEFHWHYVIDSLTKKWRYSVSENKSNDEAIEKALKYSLKNLI